MLNKERIVSMLSFAIDKIEFAMDTNRETNSVNDYLESQLGMILFNSTCMCLQVIGETLKKTDNIKPNWLKTKYSEVPWTNIFALRNIISHEYAAIDPEEILNIVKNDLPDLKDKLCYIVSDVKTSPNLE